MIPPFWLNSQLSVTLSPHLCGERFVHVVMWNGRNEFNLFRINDDKNTHLFRREFRIHIFSTPGFQTIIMVSAPISKIIFYDLCLRFELRRNSVSYQSSEEDSFWAISMVCLLFVYHDNDIRFRNFVNLLFKIEINIRNVTRHPISAEQTKWII